MLILENDTNAEVRRAVLSCIAMSPRTLPKVLKRTRDIKENVRKLAYQVPMNVKICIHCARAGWLRRFALKLPCVFLFKVLADKVHIKALSIAQRVSLLQQGLHDTSGNSDFCGLIILLLYRCIFVYVEEKVSEISVYVFDSLCAFQKR